MIDKVLKINDYVQIVPIFIDFGYDLSKPIYGTVTNINNNICKLSLNNKFYEANLKDIRCDGYYKIWQILEEELKQI